jgi:hypothetical protein
MAVEYPPNPSPNDKKKPTIGQRIKYYLMHAHAVWLVPICITLFYLLGVSLQYFFGIGVGTYDMGFWQPLILAAGAVSFAINIAIMILFFALRGLYEYLYGRKNEKGIWYTPSKEDWDSMPARSKFFIAFSVLLFFVVAILVVFLKLI